MDLTPLYQLVENCIGKLGVDPAQCRGEKPGQWSLRKGSANVWIDLWYIEREGRAYYQVMCPVIAVPQTNREAFYRELLEINDKLFAVGFTIYDNWAWLKVIRECDGLSEDEAFALLTRIGNYSDDYDDFLKNKYESSGGGPVGPSGPGGNA